MIVVPKWSLPPRPATKTGQRSSARQGRRARLSAKRRPLVGDARPGRLRASDVAVSSREAPNPTRCLQAVSTPGRDAVIPWSGSDAHLLVHCGLSSRQHGPWGLKANTVTFILFLLL